MDTDDKYEAFYQAFGFFPGTEATEEEKKANTAVIQDQLAKTDARYLWPYLVEHENIHKNPKFLILNSWEEIEIQKETVEKIVPRIIKGKYRLLHLIRLAAHFGYPFRALSDIVGEELQSTEKDQGKRLRYKKQRQFDLIGMENLVGKWVAIARTFTELDLLSKENALALEKEVSGRFRKDFGFSPVYDEGHAFRHVAILNQEDLQKVRGQFEKLIAGGKFPIEVGKPFFEVLNTAILILASPDHNQTLTADLKVIETKINKSSRD